MKAKTISSCLQVLALVALAGVLAPGVATAQDGSGRFTLPTEVHWGAAVLPAGDYRFSLDSLGLSPRLYVYNENNRGSDYILMVQDCDTIPATSEKSRLVLDQKEGGTYVKELEFPGEGLVLHFAEENSKR